MEAITTSTTTISADDLYRPRDDIWTADWLGIRPITLKTWRRLSRQTGHLVGPGWIETAGPGNKSIPRYRLIDLIAWQDRTRVGLEPARPRGRPRKNPMNMKAATAAASL